MIKECLVTLNNKTFTVVKYGDIDIQFPAINREAKTVFVNYENGKYSIVDENFNAKSEEKTKRKNTKKKTTIEESAENADINAERENENA